MKREHVHYTIIGVSVVIIVMVVLVYTRPATKRTLDPPDVLAKRLADNGPKKVANDSEVKIRAARDLVVHGEVARLEVRAALEQHDGHAPVVTAHLVDATMKNRDYRSMPMLIELLNHPNPLIRGRAGVAVQEILGMDVGLRANTSAKKRAELIEMIKHDYRQALPRLKEFYGDQTQ